MSTFRSQRMAALVGAIAVAASGCGGAIAAPSTSLGSPEALASQATTTVRPDQDEDPGPAAARTAAPTFPLAAYPGWIAYSSVTVGATRAFVRLVRTDGTDDHEIGTDVVDADPSIVDGRKHPAWSPDGTKLVFERFRYPEGRNDLFEYDLATNTSRELVHCDATAPALCAQVTEASYAPDGDRIVYFYAEGPMDAQGIPMSCGLRILTVASGVSRTLNARSCGLSEDLHPRWSPDGNRIAFYRTRQDVKGGAYTGSAIIVLDLATNEETQLTSWESMAGMFDWAPDGESIAYAAKDGKLHEMRPDGTGLRALVDLAAEIAHDPRFERIDRPRFIPDGTAIMFGIWQDGPDGRAVRRELWVVGADGGPIQEVIPKGTSSDPNNQDSHFPWASLQATR